MTLFVLATVAGTAGLGQSARADEPRSGTIVKRVPLDQIYTLPAADRTEKLDVAAIRRFLDDPQNHEPFVPEVPLGLDDPARKIPSDNPLTRAKVELGRQLYFDKRLSRDGTVSCASCHDPGRGWADPNPTSIGIKGQVVGRHAPTAVNRVYGTSQFWDGRAATLEAQSLGPIQSSIEMGFTLDELVARLQSIEGYRLQFEKVFGGVSSDAIARALASFERTILVGASPFDYFDKWTAIYSKLTTEDLEDDPELARMHAFIKNGMETNPMSESAIRGRGLYFGKANCSQCHVGANLTDEAFYNIGVGMEQPKPDLGRFNQTGKKEDTGAFKTPSLRNVAKSAPYMHDGKRKTLADVVEFYDKGGHPSPYLHQRIKKLNLTEHEKKDLVSFLEALTGPEPLIEAPALP